MRRPRVERHRRRLEYVLEGTERKDEHRPRLDDDHSKIDCRSQKLENGKREQLEHALRLRVEPSRLCLESVDRLTPQLGLSRRCDRTRRTTFVLDRLPRENRQ